MNCSFFLKNLETHFCYVPCKKTSSNALKTYRYRNIYRKNLSAIFYRLTISLFKNRDLSNIGIAQGFFKVIDYRYRLSTERFIAPITGRGCSYNCTQNKRDGRLLEESCIYQAMLC